MKKTVFIILSLLIAGYAIAQDCGVYHPTTKGTTLTYTYYQKPDKPESTCTMTVISKENTAKGVKIDVEGIAKDKKDKETIKYTYSAWCDGEIFYMDMKSMLSTLSVNDVSTYKIESTDLQFPKNLLAGQKLADASLKLSTEGPVSAGITVNYTNRKVEGFETITTSAGTFNCVKISYDFNSKVLFIKTSGKVNEWFALNVGMVKSETFDSKGRLLGTNLLTSVK